MAEQKVKLTDLPAATDTIDTAQILINQNSTDQKLPVTHFLRAKNNLSDLDNSDQARANLNVPSVDEVNNKLAGYIDGGYTFLAGGSLASRNDFIWDEESKSWYYWTGALPKDVPAASTPDSTGGIDAGSWSSIGDSLLRSMLASSTGAQLIGTNHRGTLQADLDAIDRRADGYSDNIQAVLSNGQDVQIAKNINITAAISPLFDYQVIQGAGGLVSNTTKTQAVNINGKNGVKVRDIRVAGLIVNAPTTGGNVAYAANANDCSDISMIGINTFGYTGSVQLTRVADAVVRDVYSRGNRYHSDVVAGGYGVLLGGCKRVLIDGINFEADQSKGDLGRHALYVSVVQADGTFCEDVIARNIIGRYSNIDDRNMWFINIRKSNRVLVDGFSLQGGNGGVALNPADGPVSQCQVKNGHLQVLQYNATDAVYGISGTPTDSSLLNNLLLSGISIEMLTKPGVPAVQNLMIPISLNTQRCRVSDIKIAGNGTSTPILLGSCSQLTIDGVTDTVNAGAVTQPFLRFQDTCSNIAVLNIVTPRSTMFAGTDNVTDLTVNWDRFARVVSNNGTITITDSNSLITSVTATGTGELTVVFKNHVTANALRNSTIGATSVGAPILLTEIIGKTAVLRFYTAAGVLVNLSAAIVGADISLHS